VLLEHQALLEETHLLKQAVTLVALVLLEQQ
jgi:hypothetical protein